MKWDVRASNAMLNLVLNSCFRTGYSPRALRRNFEISAGVSVAKLRRKFPEARFEPERCAGVPVERITAVKAPERTILYLHGGGYFMGSVACYRRWALKLSYRCQATVVVPEYRLAPEHPHPAALEDAMGVYRALVGAGPLFVAGDSAGGGLTLALLLKLRDLDLEMPAGAACISAWTDLTGDSASLERNADKDVWLQTRHVKTWAPWYVGENAVRSPYISPRFGDYRGLPPLLLLVGDQEVLFDESAAVAEAARKAGVPVELLVGKDMQHDWLISLPWLTESRRAMAVLSKFLRGFI